jgi:hypothetical protein
MEFSFADKVSGPECTKCWYHDTKVLSAKKITGRRRSGIDAMEFENFESSRSVLECQNCHRVFTSTQNGSWYQTRELLRRDPKVACCR